MSGRSYRIIIGTLLMVFIISRIIFWSYLSEKFDETTISLLIVSLLILLIPVENIKSLKAGGVEFELNYPQVRGAINSLHLSIIDNEKMENYVNSIPDSDLRLLQGAKILWIDDKPNSILGERRLFRALGFSITSAGSLDRIKQIVKEDNDFDLIISDIQWRDEHDPAKVEYGGIEAVKYLKSEIKDVAINSVHAIFYTAYSDNQIRIIDRQTKFRNIENHSLHYTILALLKASVQKTIEWRNNPIEVNSKKEPT